MRTRRDTARARRCAGFDLLECMMYLGLVAVVLGLSLLAFFRANENAGRVQRAAADSLRVLRAGEQWREDVRRASAPPQLEREGAEERLRLPQATGEVRYVFRDGAVWRQALPNTNWMAVLPATVASAMKTETRRHVTAWRWDVELEQRPRRSNPTVFSFTAAQREGRTP